ncbi:PREDICTED: TLC domain-containing protein 2 [Chinchilla lanigera]|uniref:TLC domain containing 2 n=1 Tax=Chinchilla lanigera TaxID=34839 RepID=A0A8C2V6N0_CHILA|nr:PREDICTED: TLC domain-containing protein 2 [Chinchilla lanigera]
MAPTELLATGASFAAFRGLHWGLKLLPAPGSTAQDRWKWRNRCVSLLHSLLTGAGSLLGLSLYPQMASDPVHGHPFWALVLVAVSVGYFLADGTDLLWNQTLGQTWELLCHHLAVVCCFGFVVLSGHYVGFSVVSLLVEVNSICLHLRILLLTSHQAPSVAFSVTSLASLGTLVLFRLIPLGWMSLWILRQHRQMPPALIILGGSGLFIVSAISIKIGLQILISDVLQPRPHPSMRHKETGGTRTCCDEPTAGDGSTLNLKH